MGDLYAPPCIWTPKNHLPGKQSKADNNVKQAVTSWLQTLDTTFCYAGIQALMPLCNQCFKVSVLIEVSCAMYTLKLGKSSWQKCVCVCVCVLLYFLIPFVYNIASFQVMRA